MTTSRSPSPSTSPSDGEERTCVETPGVESWNCQSWDQLFVPVFRKTMTPPGAGSSE